MKALILILMAASCGLLQAADLPAWAENARQQHPITNAPEGATVWRIVDVTEIDWEGGTTYTERRRVAQYVVEDRGTDDASSFAVYGDEETTKVTELSGYHRNASGFVEKRGRRDRVTGGLSTGIGYVNTEVASMTGFSNVAPGSLVSFESEASHRGYFPILRLPLLSEVWKREVEVVARAGGGAVALEPVDFGGWDLNPQTDANRFTLAALPGLQYEPASAGFAEAYPSLIIRFTSAESDRYTSWEKLGAWYFQLLTSRSQAQHGAGAVSLEAFEKAKTFMDGKIAYRQRYMSMARGWEPETGEEVARRAYGDCKDMVACFAWQLGQQGGTALPALVRIGDRAPLGPDQPPGPFFDHVIAAVPLAASLSLPAEVTVDGQIYLLYDPTAKYVRTGYLPDYYRGKQLLLCREQGGAWVTPAEAALEASSLELNVRGMLNADFKARGTMTLIERGDAFGFRTAKLEGNELDLVWGVRDHLELPGVADLELEEATLDEQGVLTLRFAYIWPGFLRRDADGFRLNESVSSWGLSSARPAGRERLRPVVLSDRPTTTWTISLGSPQVALEPGTTEHTWEDAHHRFTWKATGGKRIQVEKSYARKGAFYDRAQLEQGIAAWDDWRDAYNEFVQIGTLFRPE